MTGRGTRQSASVIEYERRRARFAFLCKEVFGDGNGAELLDILKHRYCNQSLFSPDALVMARKCAESDMVNDMVNITETENVED